MMCKATTHRHVCATFFGGGGSIGEANTTHILGYLDYGQFQVFQTTGFVAPTMRAYQLYEEDIKNYIEHHFPEHKGSAIIDHIAELTNTSHFNPEASDLGLPPDTNFNTGHFWNLNFHERHEGSRHFIMKLFNRGGYGED